MGMTMTLEGGKELESALTALPDKVAGKYMRKALHDGADIVLQSAQAEAPYRTGALRDGLEIKDGQRDGRIAVFVQTGQGIKSVQAALHSVYKRAEKKARMGVGHNTEESRSAGHEARKAAEAELKKRGLGKRDWQGQYYGNILEWGFNHTGGKTIAPDPWIARAMELVADTATEAIAASLKESVEAQGLKE